VLSRAFSTRFQRDDNVTFIISERVICIYRYLALVETLQDPPVSIVYARVRSIVRSIFRQERRGIFDNVEYLKFSRRVSCKLTE